MGDQDSRPSESVALTAEEIRRLVADGVAAAVEPVKASFSEQLSGYKQFANAEIARLRRRFAALGSDDLDGGAQPQSQPQPQPQPQPQQSGLTEERLRAIVQEETRVAQLRAQLPAEMVSRLGAGASNVAVLEGMVAALAELPQAQSQPRGQRNGSRSSPGAQPNPVQRPTTLAEWRVVGKEQKALLMADPDFDPSTLPRRKQP